MLTARSFLAWLVVALTASAAIASRSPRDAPRPDARLKRANAAITRRGNAPMG